jgi:hypothetical protein
MIIAAFLLSSVYIGLAPLLPLSAVHLIDAPVALSGRNWIDIFSSLLCIGS